VTCERHVPFLEFQIIEDPHAGNADRKKADGKIYERGKAEKNQENPEYKEKDFPADYFFQPVHDFPGSHSRFRGDHNGIG
jgi:hypothetical protein